MRKSVLAILFADVLLLALVPLLLQLGPPSQFHVMAQSSFPDPANEHACPSQTGAGGGAEAIPAFVGAGTDGFSPNRSEEHTSELQSRLHLVCRLLLEKKKKKRGQQRRGRHQVNAGL